MDRRKPIPLHFPMAGIVRRHAVQNQAPYSCIDALNVRPDSAGVPQGATATDFIRERGGSRPGLAKVFSQQLGTGNPIKLLGTTQWVESNVAKSRLVAISNGQLWEEEPAGTMALAATPGAFNTAKILRGADRNMKFYIADHSDDATLAETTYYPKVFDPATSVVSAWTADTDLGEIPFGCPFLVNWRDRAVLAGGNITPFTAHFSRQGNWRDWDYSVTDDEGAALATNLSTNGIMPEPITCVHPHSDDCLIFACPQALYIMRGDPGVGGGTDNITYHVGIVDQGACCSTADGIFVFLSWDGLYAIPAGCDASGYPTPVSRTRMPEELLAIDKATTNVAMAYDVRDRGIHIFLTPATAGAASATHWWFDWEAKSFWKSKLGSANYEPFVVHNRRNPLGSVNNYSDVFLGCRDGYIRRHDFTKNSDDGAAYPSYVWFGPFGDGSLYSDTLWVELMIVLARYSGSVTWSLHAGHTPEQAFASSPRATGLSYADRNYAKYPRVRGTNLYLKLSSPGGEGWAFESAYAVLQRLGRAGRLGL